MEFMELTERLKPLKGQVVVEIFDEYFNGGVIIKNPASLEPVTTGIVISINPESNLGVSVGDKIVFEKYGEKTVEEFAGKRICAIPEKFIQCVLGGE